MSSYKAGLLFASCASLCWAVLAIVLKYVLDFADSGTTAWIRMVTASIVLLLFFSFTNPSRLIILRKPPLLAVISALFLAMNYFAYMKGLELTSASNAQIMIQTGTILLMVAGIFYFKETLSLLQWAGLFSAFVGFGLFYWDQMLSADDTHIHFYGKLWSQSMGHLMESGTETHFYGNLWVFFGGVVWALFAVLQKKLSVKWAPQQLNVLTYIIAAIALTSVADFHTLEALHFVEWLILIGLGFNTVIAYGCLVEALKRVKASYVSFIIALDPLVTIFIIHIMGVWNINVIEHEPLTWRGWAGAFLVVSGISFALLIRSKNKKPSLQKN